MDERSEVGSWSEVGEHAGAATVLGGGVLVAATSIYVAASVLPTAVTELGGEAFYAWNMTVFLVAQVVGTTTVPRSLARVGTVRAYLAGFGLFAAGSVVCSVGPVMAVMLVGRGVQGLGAGLLTGLGFAVIRSALPRRLWSRGVALVSAMFGVGNVLGPAMGGLLAQIGAWRLAFAALAVVAAAMAVLVPRVLPVAGPDGPDGPDGPAPALPAGSLVLLVATAAMISVAGLAATPLVTAAFVAAGLALAGGFVVVERHRAVRLLPRSTFRGSSPLRWIYATIMLLACGVAVEMFLPLFGQGLGGLPPAAAGFFAAALSLGWALAQVVSASAHRRATVRALVVGGPGVLALGFAVLGLLMVPAPPVALVVAWLPIVFVAGAGIGAAVPHLSVAAMTSADDLDEAGEGSTAAASIATVLTLATAFGAAVAGLLVNLGSPDLVASARLVLAGFTVLAGLGVLTAWRATTSPVAALAPAVPTGRDSPEHPVEDGVRDAVRVSGEDQVRAFARAFARTLETRDEKACAELWGSGAIVLADRFVVVARVTDELEGLLANAWPIYDVLDVGYVEPRVVERVTLSDAMTRVRVRYSFRDRSGAHLTDGDFEYVLRRDDGALRCHIGVNISAEPNLSALALDRGFAVTRPS